MKLFVIFFKNLARNRNTLPLIHNLSVYCTSVWRLLAEQFVETKFSDARGHAPLRFPLQWRSVEPSARVGRVSIVKLSSIPPPPDSDVRKAGNFLRWLRIQDLFLENICLTNRNCSWTFRADKGGKMNAALLVTPSNSKRGVLGEVGREGVSTGFSSRSRLNSMFYNAEPELRWTAF